MATAGGCGRHFRRAEKGKALVEGGGFILMPPPICGLRAGVTLCVARKKIKVQKKDRYDEHMKGVQLKKIITVIGGTITSLGAAVLLIGSAYNNAPVPESVKRFHSENMVDVIEQGDMTQGMVTALTIPPLLRAICSNPGNSGMRELLAERTHMYEKLLKRKYIIPPCSSVMVDE